MQATHTVYDEQRNREMNGDSSNETSTEREDGDFEESPVEEDAMVTELDYLALTDPSSEPEISSDNALPMERANPKHTREEGYKANDKPLIWRQEIEEYPNEKKEIDDLEVLRTFISKIEDKPPVMRKMATDQYYATQKGKEKEASKRVHAAKSALLKGNRLLLETHLLYVRDKIRENIKSENTDMHRARKLHVWLKQQGYTTESSLLYAAITKAYVQEKRTIIAKMESIANKISQLHVNIRADASYIQKCAEFLDRS